MHTLNENYKAIQLLPCAAVTSTTTHTGIDVEKYCNDAIIIVNWGTVSGTTPTDDTTIETSTDGTNYTAAVITFAQNTTANKMAAAQLNLAGIKKIRAKSTIGGTTPSFTKGITLLVEARAGSSSLNSTTPA